MNNIKIIIVIFIAAAFALGSAYSGGSLIARAESGHEAEEKGKGHEGEKAGAGDEHGHEKKEAVSEKHEHEAEKSGNADEKHEHSAEPAGSGDGHGHEKKTAAEPEIKIDGLVEETVAVETVYETVKSNGIVKFHPDHYAKIAPLVPGRVKEIKAKLGDSVKKGQELAVIESIDIFNAKVEYLKNYNKYEVSLAKYENIIKMGDLGAFTQKNVEEARASLSDARLQSDKSHIAYGNAQKKYERIKKLVESGVSSRSELEAAESDMKNAAVEVESARTKLDSLEKSMSRVEKLSDSKISLKKEVADIQTEFAEASLNLDASGKYLKMVGIECDPLHGCKFHELGSFSIYSPIDGIVMEQNAVIGASVDSQSQMMAVGDYDLAIADIDIYEKDHLLVKTGQMAVIENSSGAPVAGKVVYISNQFEQNTRTIKARVEITENSNLLKIGEFINCDIQVAERKNAITVPLKAIVEDGDRQLVFVKCEKTYDKTYVKTGFKFRDRVEITSGLAPGNIVVTVGNYQLFNMGLSGKLELSCDTCK